MIPDYKNIVSSLPSKPGVYQFLDESGKIIYVGKAKNLRNRVGSYFSGTQPPKTTVMLKKAVGIRHIVVDNESDALLLENNIIKEQQPRYNILLKDDKTFPWICIRKEPFPRVFSTRNTFRDGSVYFGPYTSGLMVKTLLNTIKQIYKLRSCSLKLTSENIKSGKFKPCLEYHIGNCKAPCIGLQDEFDYEENINQIEGILKGNISSVIEHLKDLMMKYSSETRFEEAQIIKEKIEILSKYKSRSTIVNPKIKNVDVFGFTADSSRTYVSFMKVVNGAVIQAYTLDLKHRVDEEEKSLLSYAITEIKQRLSNDSPEIIVPFKPDILFENIKYTVPQKGDKKKLLELAERNAVYYKLEHNKKQKETGPVQRTSRNLERLKQDLHLNELPVHIECFDNSNLFGKNPVASCVVFRNTRPSRKEYRHFNIKTVSGTDDFSSMEEIVYRRYKRMLEAKESLPQLVVVDGGKGQLSSAVKSLKILKLENKIKIIAIAKKLEEIYFPGDPVPLYIDKNSISLKIIQQLRNEAHRFGINFHRNKRSSDLVKSELDTINGIGVKSKEILFKELGSVDKIKNTGLKDLEKLLGRHKARIIFEYFKK